MSSKNNLQEVRYVTLDWLTMNFQIECDVLEFISEYLHMDYDDFIFNEGGIGRSYHYARTATFENIQIYYSLPEDILDGANSGLTLNLNGKACRQFEIYQWSQNEHWNWYILINELQTLSAKCSRLDIAYDFINSKFTWQFILEKIYKKTLIFAGKVFRYNAINQETGADYNASIYFGKKPQQLNIYDKKGERFDRDGEIYDVTNWTRWELRLFGDKAMLAFLELSDGRSLGDLFKGILAAHYRFVTLTGDQNRSRRSDARWWTEFLAEAKETKLLIEKNKPTMTSKENWLINNGPEKAELLVYLRDLFVYGNDQALDNLIKRISYQRTKLTNKDIQLILQSVIEEMNSNESVRSTLNTKAILETLEKMLPT